MVLNSVKPRSSGQDDLGLTLIYYSVVSFLIYCSCRILSATPFPDLTMALGSKSAYNPCSTIKLHLMILLYNNDAHTKILLFLWLEAQKRSQRWMAIVKMAFFWSYGSYGTHKQDFADLISQDPSMGLV